MATRAVHLEIAGDLSSDSFVLSLRVILLLVVEMLKKSSVRQRNKFTSCRKCKSDILIKIQITNPK